MSHEVSKPTPSPDDSTQAVIEPQSGGSANSQVSDVTETFGAKEMAHWCDAATIDESATTVIDEVFEDVEQLLNERAILPREKAILPRETKSAAPAPNPLASLASSLIPSLLSTRSSEDAPEASATRELDKPLAIDSLALDDEDMDDLAAIATEGGEIAPLKEGDSTSSKVTNKSFDTLLLTLASISVVVTGGFWLLAQNLWGESSPEVATVPVEAESATSVDREFMNYLQRSLEVVDEQAEIANETTALASRLDLPEVSVPGSTAAPGMTNLGQPYVPVYQAPQPPTVNGTATAPAAPNNVAVAPSPTVTTTPMRPTPAAPTAPSTAGEVPNIAATNTHVLVGLLELGDRSAALFEINGTAQRLQLGESIGSSGWTLVSVSNQEAVIRRNGEVRSVYVGQRF
ncbi:hypothetical protein [Vacuolonema iberomarrocanum]|uniref:hypothetical protein n=1 Tax=Vacuolonema iberomarrocanum TaxID=3454632 RepID=UPI0019FF495D|nr:hypothetical protein [filamentous cyanobacterium LEGE 07170]